MVLKVCRQKFKMFLNRNVIWNTNVAFAGNSRIDAVLIAFNPLLAEKRQNLYTSK